MQMTKTIGAGHATPLPQPTRAANQAADTVEASSQTQSTGRRSMPVSNDEKARAERRRIRRAARKEVWDNPPWTHRLAGFGLRMTMGAFRYMPGFLAYAIGDLIAIPYAAYHGMRDRKGLRSSGYHRNIRIVSRSPDIDLNTRGLLWRYSRHMMWMGVEFARMTKITRENFETYFESGELWEANAICQKYNGVICASGHMGMSELIAYAAALSGLGTDLVVRPSPLSPVDKLLVKVRKTCGMNVHGTDGALRTLKRGLDAGNVVGMAADVSSRRSRVFAPFLGTTSASSPGAAILHVMTGKPIVVATMNRVGRERFRFHTWDVIYDMRTGDRPADLEAITTRINNALSRAVLAYPEQWFWHGRRYRWRPRNEVAESDGLPPLAPASPLGSPSNPQRASANPS